MHKATDGLFIPISENQIVKQFTVIPIIIICCEGIITGLIVNSSIIQILLGCVMLASLKEELMLTEDFQKENQERIQEFLFEGGAEIMAAYLKSRPGKQEEIRRLVVAELLGKFQELKYPDGDLEREIAYPITPETEKNGRQICAGLLDASLQEKKLAFCQSCRSEKFLFIPVYRI